MRDAKVSLYGASNRPYLWDWMHENFKMNKTPYEVILVGDSVPIKSLPPNFTYIYSTVKVTQCAFIAATRTVGEAVIHIADDFQFSPYALDVLYERYVRAKDQNDYKLMPAPSFYGYVPPELGGHNETDTHGDLKYSDGIKFALMHIYNRNFIEELGWYDKRFRFDGYEADLMLRAQMAGGKFEHLKECWVCERKDLCKEPKTGWERFDGRGDNWLLKQMWYEPPDFVKFAGYRNTRVTPFVINKTLLTISQELTENEND